MADLTHVDQQGRVNMVDVGGKAVTRRVAVAEARVRLQAATVSLIARNALAKGDVLATVRIAGIQAAKRCADLIPLCHPVLLSKVEVDIRLDEAASQAVIRATCTLDGKTGVEMEALAAASVAALTLYDMCKAVDRGMVIESVQLLEKTGGQHGDWRRD